MGESKSAHIIMMKTGFFRADYLIKLNYNFTKFLVFISLPGQQNCMNAFKWIWTVQVVLIIVLQFRLWAGEGSFAQMTMLQKEIDQQQQINDKLADRNAVLAAEVKSLKSGFDAIEENARYQLGMVKKNETFFLVVDS